MGVGAVRNSVHNLRPTLAEISGLVDIRPDIVELMRVDGCIRGSGIKRRRLDQADQAPLRNSLWRHVRPVLAAIAGDVNQAIVGSRPEQILLHRRFCDREDRVVIFDRRVVLGQRSARRNLLALVVARQVRADRCPTLAFVCCFEHALCGRVDRRSDRAAKSGSAASIPSDTSCRRRRDRQRLPAKP